eukprot:5492590-Pyramimonas_sp.AAC.2
MSRWLASGNFDYLLWIDADAVLVDFTRDVIQQLIQEHPHAHMVVCREPRDAQGFEVMNSGTVLVKNSEWSREFLHLWVSHPR